MAGKIQILVEGGELGGRRFDVPPGGLRFGRSSSNDIHPTDAGLSRNHCMFQTEADGAVSVIDLASANGTYVNGELLGTEARKLSPGDEIAAGDTLLRVVAEGAPDAAQGVDLGLGGPAPAESAPAAPAPGRRAPKFLYIVAAALVAATAALLLLPQGGASKRASRPDARDGARADGEVASLYFEKIDADHTHISRYCAELGADGTLRVVFADIPGENRKIEKSAKISKWARDELANLFSGQEWKSLENSYSGADAASENALRARRIRVVAGGAVKDVKIENTVEPPAFAAVRQRLETLANNELGVQSVLRPRAELLESSSRAETAGDAKWDERDVEYRNLSECISLYRSAKNDLASLSSEYEAAARIQRKIEAAEAELSRRYEEVRFEAERAKQIGDWEKARDAFRRLCDMIPDKADPRHAEANSNMVDVEKRIEAVNKKERGK